MGHTHLTHPSILKRDPPSQCEHCQRMLTVRHMLVECNQLVCLVEAIYIPPHTCFVFYKNASFILNFLIRLSGTH